MVRDTPTERRQAEKTLLYPERLEQFTAGEWGRQDTGSGTEGQGDGEEMEIRQPTDQHLSVRAQNSPTRHLLRPG